MADVVRKMTNLQRVGVGILAGLVAACSKFLAQDYKQANFFLENLQYDLFWGKMAGFLLLLTILMIVGGVTCWASDETRKLKLLALGVSAPALATTWMGDVNTPRNRIADNSPVIERSLGYNLVPSAYARSVEVMDVEKVQFGHKKIRVAESTFYKGLRSVFGIDPAEPRYWVIVGSHTDKAKAEAQAKSIAIEAPNLKPFVGLKRPNNLYFPVIVGGFNKLQVARKLKYRALKLNSVKDAYVDAYARRRPQG